MAVFFSPAFFISLCTSPSGTTCFIKISREIWPGPLSCTTWTKRECKLICAERSPSYVLRHFRFPYVASLKSFELNSSWVPEVFLARGGNFRCWPKADISSAVRRNHEPETPLEKSLAPRVGQGFESRTSMNFFWLCFETAKNCVKNAMIFFHTIQLTLLKVLKTFETNVSAARPWVRCLTHGAFHVPYTTYIPEIGVLISQSFRG